MTDRKSNPTFESSRRQLLLRAAALCLVGAIEIPLVRTAAAAAAERYVNTIDALKQGIATETAAHRRYVEFGQHAKRNGYKGLAYLYTALAISEMIHSQTYIRVLAVLGDLSGAPQTSAIPLGTAKENLIYAAERELDSIENTYPALLQTVEAEGHADAIAAVQYSWASHKQHLDIIEKIKRWSPGFFESVAGKLEEKADRYFVCQTCGSTMTEIPKNACPICKQPASEYRLIPPDRFF